MVSFCQAIHVISSIRIIFFLTGASFGIYERWEHHTSDVGFLVFGLSASVLYSCSFIAYLYGYKAGSSALVNLFNGIILSIFSFTPIAYNHLFVSLQDLNITDILLMISVFIKCGRILLMKICGKAVYSPKVLTSDESFLLIGFIFASSLTRKETQFTLLAVALLFTVISFHLKSSLSILNGMCFLIVSHEWFFSALGVKYNPFCILVFIVELCFEPLVDMYFSPLSILERWNPIFSCKRWVKRCSLLLLLMWEFFYLFHSSHVFHGFHKFFYRLPVFVLAVLMWFCFRVLFFITCWGFITKIEECYNVLKLKNDFSDSSISEVFASKGVRHFCLISDMVMVMTLATTLIIGALSLQGGNEYLIVFLLIVLSQEHIVCSLLRKLGRIIGGTAIGYALVTPTYSFNDAGEVLLLTNSSKNQVVTGRSLSLLNNMSQFFSNHMIHNFGTDFLTSGITEEYVEGKLKSFFAQDAIEGVNFDTYILYYSGQTHANGDWALKHGHTLTFEMIIKWWQLRNSRNGARLLCLLDSVHSHQWLKKLSNIDKDYIAIQTAALQDSVDEEQGNVHLVGDLTQIWLDFNSSDSTSSDNKDFKVKPVYSVTKSWSSFRFHEPTDDDISHYVQETFPSITKPFVDVLRQLPWTLSCPVVFCICDGFMQCLRQVKMKWFPPLVLDTGHGFKLVTVH